MSLQHPNSLPQGTPDLSPVLPDSSFDIPTVANPATPDFRGLTALPLVQRNVFGRMPSAHYLVSLLAVGNRVIDDAGFTAARQLRYQVYRGQNWLDDTARDADGGEHDKFDAHSAQFGVIKQTYSGPQMIATSRLILKENEGHKLPVEEDFPEVFGPNEPPVGDTEISRLISASANKKERALASLALQRAMIGWGNFNGYFNTHAMVEPYLLRRLNALRIPLEQRSGFKPIAEYDVFTLNGGAVVWKSFK